MPGDGSVEVEGEFPGETFGGGELTVGDSRGQVCIGVEG
ncbi:MAG: hypothetical protein RI897_3394 [Verrucomicrobiota bacterium]